MGITINSLELENVKKIKAVKLKPSAKGLTVIGGKNGQGKTSVLDAIAWTLGGEAFRPSAAQREGSVIPPKTHIVLSNGIVVDRQGKNSSLKVTDTNGQKGGQQLLNAFVEQFALNLPKFLEASSKEKASTLLKIIGVEEELMALEKEEKETYNERTAIGRIADQKEKYAKEQEFYPEAPREPVSASDLIKEQQEILARNGENQKKREKAEQIARDFEEAKAKVKALEESLAEARAQELMLLEDLEIARKNSKDLQDESTEELEKSISNIDDINRKVRANLDKEKAEEDARAYRAEYDTLTKALEDIRKKKKQLLDHADLPLEELSVEDGELLYRGQKWDCMSGSERLKVATAIVRKLNPECGFVLLDKLEQMDRETLDKFGEWAEQEGLQVIATRVSDGDDCTIYIEDGYSVDKDGNRTAEDPQEKKPTKKWKEGEF